MTVYGRWDSDQAIVDADSRYKKVASKQYMYWGVSSTDPKEWERKATATPGVRFLHDIYHELAGTDTFGPARLTLPSFEDDFRDKWTEAQALLIYQQEFRYPVKTALSKYGADKFSGGTNKQKKLVYDAWVTTMDDDSIFKKLRAGAGLYNAFHWGVSDYASNAAKLTDTNYYNINVENKIEALINDLGFADWANENAPSDDSKLTGVGDLETATTEQLATITATAAEAEGIEDTLPSEEEGRNLRQCALMTNLMHKGYSYTDYPNKWQRGYDAYNKAFNGRIYPVTNAATFDANSLSNLCFMPNDVQDFFENSERTSDQLHWKLFWVYRDALGLNETEILKSAKLDNDSGEKVQPLKRIWGNPNALTKDLKEIIKADYVANFYSIDTVNITYDGTNPATARNDVKVDIKISMNHVGSINTICAFAPVVSERADSVRLQSNDRGGTALIKLRDLVTVPQDKSVTVVTPGGGAYFANTYTPETSRIRLKVWYEGDIENFTGEVRTDDNDVLETESSTGTSTAIILDLSLIDHTITRNSDKVNSAELSISYRGYFEEAMNAPYNDALTDSTMIQKRIDRVMTMKKASDAKCSDNLIREMKRVMDEEQRVETEAFHRDGGLVKVLFDKDLMYKYEIDNDLYSLGQFGSTLDPTLGNYITGITKSSDTWAVVAGESKLASASRRDAANPAYYERRYQAELEIAQEMLRNAQAGGNASRIARRKQDVADLEMKIQGSKPNGQSLDIVSRSRQNESFAETANTITDHCFFLGDLMEVVLDCLYKPGTADHWSHTRDMNTRFIVGTIEVPDPSNLDETININPLQIPIDLAFFNSWYHDTIAKKGVQNYAVGPFIKDLLERMINDVLYESCFALLQLDESPPQLRSTFVTDHSGEWFRTSEKAPFWYTPNLNGRKVLMKKDIYASPTQARNYCLIYQQYPSFFRQKKTNPTSHVSLRLNPNVPTLYDGYNNRGDNFCNEVSFAKAENAKYLKEARYFNNSFGNLALFANVYNLNFNFMTKKMNTFIYPGTIINFIVTDFIEGNFTPGNVIPDNGDPHFQGSIPNILGMGGYFVVIKVTYALVNLDSNAANKISIETRFIGTDARVPIVGTDSSTNPFADEPVNCIEDHTAAVNSLRQTEIDTGIDAQEFTLLHTNSKNNSYAAPLPEITAPPPTTGGASSPAPTKEPEVVSDPAPHRQNSKFYETLEGLSFDQITLKTKKTVNVGGVKYKATVKKIDKQNKTVEWKVVDKNEKGFDSFLVKY